MNQCMETKEQHIFSSDWAQNGLCSFAPTDVTVSYISSCWKWVGLDWSISSLYLKRKKLNTFSPDLNFYKSYPCYLHFLWLSHLHLNITDQESIEEGNLWKWWVDGNWCFGIERLALKIKGDNWVRGKYKKGMKMDLNKRQRSNCVHRDINK